MACLCPSHPINHTHHLLVLVHSREAPGRTWNFQTGRRNRTSALLSPTTPQRGQTQRPSGHLLSSLLPSTKKGSLHIACNRGEILGTLCVTKDAHDKRMNVTWFHLPETPTTSKFRRQKVEEKFLPWAGGTEEGMGHFLTHFLKRCCVFI